MSNHPEVGLSKEIKSRIIGLTLGDGHINKHNELVIRHSWKQYDYLMYKANYIENVLKLGKVRIYRNVTEIKDRNKKYVIYTLKVFNTNLNKIRRKLYPHGRKTIRVPVLNNLNEQDLTFWFLDDGSLQRTGGNKSKGSKYVGVKFATDSFSIDEHHIILKILKKKFGIIGRIHFKKGNPYLYLDFPNTIKFVDICYPYLKEIKSMEYKWRAFYISNTNPRVQADFESLSDRELKTCLFVKYYKFPELDKNQDKELIVKFYGNIYRFEQSIQLSKIIHNNTNNE